MKSNLKHYFYLTSFIIMCLSSLISLISMFFLRDNPQVLLTLIPVVISGVICGIGIEKDPEWWL